MRTNIDIDDKLLKQAMRATGTTTKKGAVEAALRQAVQLKKQAGIRRLFGKVVWRGPDDDWLASDEEILKKRQEANQVAAGPPLNPDAPAEERETVGKRGHL